MDKHQPDRYPSFSLVGDSALLVELDDAISLPVNERILALDAWLRQSHPRGFVECVPAYTSLLIFYDPLIVHLSDVRTWLEESLECSLIEVVQKSNCVAIPVHYGCEYGPDLLDVAKFHCLSPEQVIEKHTAQVYRVGMMGFTPGFAYLIGLDQNLSTPRRSSPRTFVPAGSVGIAGNQTGVYPLDSPGGWQLIGKTDRVLVDWKLDPPFLLSPGDEVRFYDVKTGEMS